jgi:hypothetical protein
LKSILAPADALTVPGLTSKVCGLAPGGIIVITVTLSLPILLTISPRGKIVAATLILPSCAAYSFFLLHEHSKKPQIKTRASNINPAGESFLIIKLLQMRL